MEKFVICNKICNKKDVMRYIRIYNKMSQCINVSVIALIEDISLIFKVKEINI